MKSRSGKPMWELHNQMWLMWKWPFTCTVLLLNKFALSVNPNLVKAAPISGKPITIQKMVKKP